MQWQISSESICCILPTTPTCQPNTGIRNSWMFVGEQLTYHIYQVWIAWTLLPNLLIRFSIIITRTEFLYCGTHSSSRFCGSALIALQVNIKLTSDTIVFHGNISGARPTHEIPHFWKYRKDLLWRFTDGASRGQVTVALSHTPSQQAPKLKFGDQTRRPMTTSRSAAGALTDQRYFSHH